VFGDWCALLPAAVEVVAVQYPGRGVRFGEPLITSCDEIVATLAEQIAPFAQRPFAFFGHSNGSLVSFELARTLQARGNFQQRHHFIAAKRAIHLPRETPMRHTLSDAEFILKLHELGGTPTEVLRNRELTALLLPALRADFSLAETFTLQSMTPLQADVTLLRGRHDSAVSEDDMNRWRELLRGTVETHCFEGGHFFIRTHKRQVLELVRGKLLEILQARTGANPSSSRESLS
jgi:medium-chain acyl-[acyl-carrier-protein] hydrolase